MFEACRIAYEPTPAVNSGKACQLSEDIVSVSCLPDSWAACEETPQLYFASIQKRRGNSAKIALSFKKLSSFLFRDIYWPYYAKNYCIFEVQ
jgi:hypothetical protein